MAIYPTPCPHERLNVFFGELFREICKTPPEAYGTFFARSTTDIHENILAVVEELLI